MRLKMLILTLSGLLRDMEKVSLRDATFSVFHWLKIFNALRSVDEPQVASESKNQSHAGSANSHGNVPPRYTRVYW